MRQTVIITDSLPETELVAQFEVASIQISNPTLSPIAFRQGGTDFPTINSADFVIPAETLLRIPAIGNQFAFQFTNVPLLQSSSIKSAKITGLSINEASTGIGSVQPFARPVYYESARNPTQPIVSFNQFLDPPSNVNGTRIYQVPLNRRAKIAAVQTEIVCVPPFNISEIFQAVPLIDFVSNGTIHFITLNADFTAANQVVTKLIGLEYFLNPADSVFINFGANGNHYRLDINVLTTEFDA